MSIQQGVPNAQPSCYSSWLLATARKVESQLWLWDASRLGTRRRNAYVPFVPKYIHIYIHMYIYIQSCMYIYVCININVYTNSHVCI